jgi:Tfp pilus assembly protein PilF
MRSLRYLSLFFVLYVVMLLPKAYGQQDIATDSMSFSKQAENAKSDELFFDALKAKLHDDYKEARKLFEQFAAQRPDVAATYYELCNLSYDDKQMDQAEQYIKKAISLDDGNKWYKEEYASLLADKGEYLKAGELMAGLAKTYPEDANYPRAVADFYIQAKKYKEALPYLDRALLSSEGDEDLMERKVKVYLGLNDVDKAAEVVRQLISHDQMNSKYYVWLAALYDDNKMPRKADEVYKEAVKLIPDDPVIQSGIADHYLKSGDTAAYVSRMGSAIINKDQDVEVQLDQFNSYLQKLPNDSTFYGKAMPILRQLVAQHPDNDGVYALQGEFYEIANKKDSAAIAYKRSLQIKSSNYPVWLKFLNNYSGKEDADSLIKYSEKFIRLFPSQAEAQYFNAIGHYNKKEYAVAIKAISRAIDFEPDNNRPMVSSLYSLQAEIYYADKQDELSDKAYDKALFYDADNASVLNNYAYHLSERGIRLDDALRMSGRSLELRPGEATFLDTYGWILYKRGEYEKARDQVQKAINTSGASADGTLYDHLGNILFKLNDKEKAVQYWKMAKEKGGSDDPQLDKKISEGKLYE